MLVLIIVGIILLIIFSNKEGSTTAPQQAIYEHVLSVDEDCAVACGNVPGSTIVYSVSPTVNSGVILYKNEQLTEPVDNNCYARSVEQTEGVFLSVNYQVTDGLGEITNSQFCE